GWALGSIAGAGAHASPGQGGFFFQAEDGIRDRNVTGVQKCALPISEVTKSPLSVNLAYLSKSSSNLERFSSNLSMLGPNEKFLANNVLRISRYLSFNSITAF